MAELEEIRVRGIGSVRWPEGDPRANENPPEDTEPEVRAEEQQSQAQKENEE